MKIAPSLLSADFANLEKEVREIEKSGADLLHLDMMDGHFVPNLTFGVPIINAIRKHTKLPFDIHMMVFNPEKYLDELEKVGVQMISFHQEASIHQDRIIQEIKERKIKGTKKKFSFLLFIYIFFFLTSNRISFSIHFHSIIPNAIWYLNKNINEYVLYQIIKFNIFPFRIRSMMNFTG